MIETSEFTDKINQMEGVSKEVIFALCQKCFWLATYFNENEKNCPICNARLTINRVIVSRKIPRSIKIALGSEIL